MTQQIRTQTFDNGLTLVSEAMPWLESAAFSLLVPAGCLYDPPQLLGLANFTADMMERGCGDLSSREYLEKLERLGVSHHSSVGVAHAAYGGAMVADNLLEAMWLYAALVRQPLLPEDQLEASRQVCLQELRGVEDNLAQRLFMELYRRIYPDPWGRSSHGTVAATEDITIDNVRDFFAKNYSPRKAILSVAGKVDWEPLCAEVDRLFGTWTDIERAPVVETAPAGGYCHIPVESSQTHIAVAFAGVPYKHPDYFQARGAVGVLSDGMSSRLFTEIREKQGLCYTVSASCHSSKDRGSVVAYSATSTDRAQQTLDSLLHELNRLREGVQQDELDRLKAQIKSSLIMQQESSYARSNSIATDWYYLGRVRTIEEISALIDGLTCDSINNFLAAHPPGKFTIVTLGARELEVPA